MRSSALATLAVVAAVLHGHVVDKTTEQPLVHVGVDVLTASGKRVAHAVTDGDGAFVVRGLRRGTYAFALSSDDVPRIVRTASFDPAHPKPVELTACSTTLDYSCAGVDPSVPGGG